jgi:hypothetical protein
MNKLGLVITDGVGFRNFIISNFISEAEKKFDEVVILSCLNANEYKDFCQCKVVELPVFKEQFMTWFFRKIKEVAHLQQHRNDNFGIQDNFNLNNSKIKSTRGYATRIIYLWTSIFHSERCIRIYNKLQQWSFRKNNISILYKDILKNENLNLLFFTHQRPPYIAPLLYQSELLNIKNCTFIFSWDNISSKARMMGDFDWYLVWSELMKKELMHFYPLVKSNEINVVGTPQFESYKIDKYGYEKDVLIKKFKLIKNKPIIFFTCNDASSENDPIYLDLLAKFIVINKLEKEVNLVVRTSPAEEADRFSIISKKYPFISWNYPKWKMSRSNHPESWSQRVPSVEDINDLKSILKYCDLNINVLSTITLDSFIFDKPVINPVFGNKNNDLFDDQKFLKYDHLMKLVESNSSKIVKNEKEFIDAITTILKGKDNKEFKRKKFLEFEISKPIEGTSRRIVEALKELN